MKLSRRIRFVIFAALFFALVVDSSPGQEGANRSRNAAISADRQPLNDSEARRSDDSSDDKKSSSKTAAERAQETKKKKETARKLADEALRAYDGFLKQFGFKENGRAKTTSRFVFVYNTSDPYIEWLSALMEEVASGFEKYVVKIGFKRVALEKPMLVYVFATREEFDAFERNLYAQSGKMGDYENRENNSGGFYVAGPGGLDLTVLYDQTSVEEARVNFSESSGERDSKKPKKFSRSDVKREANSIKMRDDAVYNTETIVHETTHQMSYNYKVLNPKINHPAWIVEGMAMTLEPSDGSATLGWKYRNKRPINALRYDAFSRFAREDPSFRLVDELIVSNAPIEQLRKDGYCYSWALFYYCYNKRSKELAKYIAINNQKKENEKEIPEDERRADFVECFGEIGEFKKDFIKYMRSL